MKLVTDEIRKVVPELYSQDGKGDKAVAYVKFFTPWSNWIRIPPYTLEFQVLDLYIMH